MFKYLAIKGPKSCKFLSNDSQKKKGGCTDGWLDGWMDRKMTDRIDGKSRANGQNVNNW